MIVEELKTYESWNLETPALPKPSHLYSLEPIGMATPFVESLTSYIARLAQAHRVSVATLIRYKLAILFLKRQSLNLSGYESTFSHWQRQPLLLQEIKAESWLDKTKQVEKIVSVLEELTLRQDLSYLTLLPWKQFFSLKNVFHSQQLWCPACYQEWRDTETIIYEPLLWALVEVCPRHQRYLQTWCLYCHCPQPFLKLQVKSGYCSECGAWLGRWVEPLSQPRPQAEEWDWNLWIALAVGQLLAAMPLLINRTQISGGKQSIPSQRQPTLKAFLKQCYKHEISPLDSLNLLIHTSFTNTS